MIIKRTIVVVMALIVFGCSNPMVSLAATNDDSMSTEEPDTLKDARSIVDKLYNDNAYLKVHIGRGEQDVIYMLYNKDKECYIELGYAENFAAIMRNDYKVVNIENTVDVTEDIDVLSFINRVLDMTETGEATLRYSEKKDKTITGYCIEVRGKRNIREIYTVISDKYADEMADMLFGINCAVDKHPDPEYADINDDDNDLIKVGLWEDADGKISAQCNMVIDGVEYINWWFNGHHKLDDFKLSEGWYKNVNTIAEWQRLINELQAELKINIDKNIR